MIIIIIIMIIKKHSYVSRVRTPRIELGASPTDKTYRPLFSILQLFSNVVVVVIVTFVIINNSDNNIVKIIVSLWLCIYVFFFLYVYARRVFAQPAPHSHRVQYGRPSSTVSPPPPYTLLSPLTPPSLPWPEPCGNNRGLWPRVTRETHTVPVRYGNDL